MNSIALVSYNQIGGGNKTGWQKEGGRRALVIQNSKGEQFAATYAGERGDNEVRREINTAWDTLQGSLKELDQVVVYVGTSGSERAIELAAQLPPEKVTFVLCDCGLHGKRALINQSGLGMARQILCECRGVHTMGRILSSFLATGRFQ